MRLDVLVDVPEEDKYKVPYVRSLSKDVKD